MTLHAGGSRIRSTLRLVVARDGATCRRCGELVDLYRSGLDADGPTLGHILAVKHGGGDELANLALEHRRCNLAAGSRVAPPRAILADPLTRWRDTE
jgi:5-methylcytosine-specific restriction endonuclease McrA